jgi:hypothetical protein
MYGFIVPTHKVCVLADKTELVSGVCLWCCFIYFCPSICHVDDVPIAIWAYDDTCEVLLINLTIFLCICYFAFFYWPYVSANDAGNIYLSLWLGYRRLYGFQPCLKTAHLVIGLHNTLRSFGFRRRSADLEEEDLPCQAPGAWRTPNKRRWENPWLTDSSRLQDLPDEHGTDRRITPDLCPSGNLRPRAPHTLHQIGSKRKEMEEVERLKKGR